MTAAIAERPARITVVARLWEHGISLWDVPLWEFFELVASGTIAAEVASTDPADVRFDVALGDDRLRLRMVGTLAVTIRDSPHPAETARSSE